MAAPRSRPSLGAAAPTRDVEELLLAQLSPTFASYLRGFRGMVAAPA